MVCRHMILLFAPLAVYFTQLKIDRNKWFVHVSIFCFIEIELAAWRAALYKKKKNLLGLLLSLLMLHYIQQHV